jgi:hypothetical protein
MHVRKIGVESFEKLSREGKIKRKVWVWKRKKEKKYRKVKKEKKYENERRKKKEEKEKEKRGGSYKDMRGMDQVKEKKNKV